MLQILSLMLRVALMKQAILICLGQSSLLPEANLIVHAKVE